MNAEPFRKLSAPMHRIHLGCVLAGAGLGLAWNLAAADVAVRVTTPTIGLYEPLEFAIDWTQPLGNNTANTVTRVEAQVRAPDGKAWLVPCFDSGGFTTESARWAGRFAARQPGRWQGTVTVSSGRHTLKSDAFVWEVLPGKNHGFLHVEPKRMDAFRFDDGTYFRGLGSNLGWAPRRARDGTVDHRHSYETMIPQWADQGANFIRTWICPWNMPLEWKRHGLGRYDPESAQRLDALLDLARRHGIYVLLVLDYHGVLRTTPDSWGGNDEWKNNPYNRANGGPCASPAEYFTHPEARRHYQNRLRYMVARWAAHPNLAAWEFFNEIDIPIKSESIPKEAIIDWHREMSAFLKSIDPIQHPISTSLSHGDLPELWAIRDLDFVMTHAYKETSGLPALIEEMAGRYGKPYVAGEFGYSWKHPNEIKQPERYRDELRLGLWRGLFSPTPVLPLTWWWEYHQDRGEFAFLKPVRFLLNRMLESSQPLTTQDWTGPDGLEIRGLRGSGRDFVWLHNSGEAPSSSTFIQGPSLRGGLTTVITMDTGTNSVASARIVPLSDQKLPVAAMEPKTDRALELSAPPQSLSQWAALMRHQLAQEIFPYWLRQTVDTERGGFLMADELGGPIPAKHKQLVSQSRMIWGFAHAHLHGFDLPDRRYLKAAEQGYRFLIGHFLDATNGGYFWSTDLEGVPLNDRKILYGQAFVVYALVEYFRASHDQGALDKAMELFRIIQAKAYDSKQGGWVEHFRADWKPILAQERGIEVEIAGLKSANTHLHLMEAWTELYAATRDASVRQALEESVHLNQTWFYPADPAASAFHRHPDGTRATGGASDGLSYGHNVEFAWLLIHAEKVLERPPSWEHALAHLRHALDHGYDHELGGLYNKGHGNAPATDTEKVWWSQAEWVAALSDALRYQPNDTFDKAAQQTLAFVQRQMIDPKDAIWIASVTRDGTPKWKSKAHEWKANYHDVRALVKLIENHSAERPQ